jgi:hypothetical protein
MEAMGVPLVVVAQGRTGMVLMVQLEAPVETRM